jgi:histone deacetylase complex regulatory component SIN3
MLQSKKTNSSTSIDDFVVEGEIDDWLKGDDIKENKKQKFVAQPEMKTIKSANSHFRKITIYFQQDLYLSTNFDKILCMFCCIFR